LLFPALSRFYFKLPYLNKKQRNPPVFLPGRFLCFFMLPFPPQTGKNTPGSAIKNEMDVLYKTDKMFIDF